jgi:anti-sigma B factor antagonist
VGKEGRVSLLISARKSGSITILDLRGRITIGAGSDSLKDELHRLAEVTPCDVLINLAEVTQMDSTGINALVHSYVTLKRNGGELKILQPTGYVREVLEVTHLTDCLPVYTEEAEALASFRDRAAHA